MKIAILPGDGIGTEIVAEAVKVLNVLDLQFETETALVGGAAYEAHGHLVKDDVVEVRWQAQGPANALPGAYYDEFVLRGTPAGPAGPLWFKVLQGCDGGQSDWAEVPASGRSTRGLKAPAALLEVVAPAPVAAPSTPAAPAAHVH